MVSPELESQRELERRFSLIRMAVASFYRHRGDSRKPDKELSKDCLLACFNSVVLGWPLEAINDAALRGQERAEREKKEKP